MLACALLRRARVRATLTRLFTLILTAVVLCQPLVPARTAQALADTLPASPTRAEVSALSTASAMTPTVNGAAAPFCALYPIAMHTHMLAGVAPGGMLPDVLNGTQPGNFGWLSWTGTPSTPSRWAFADGGATGTNAPLPGGGVGRRGRASPGGPRGVRIVGACGGDLPVSYHGDPTAAPSPELLSIMALNLDGIITARNVRDWTRNPNVHNGMRTAIEDYLYELRRAASLMLTTADIDRILDAILELAKQRERMP